MNFFKKNKTLVLIFILSIGFLVLIAYSADEKKASIVEDGAAISINAPQGFVYKICNNIRGTFSFLANFDKIKKENEELSKLKNEMERTSVENKLLKKENERLRAMLNFKESRSEYNYIGCDIIGISGNNFLDGFVINKGTKNGIKRRMVAITSDGLVGQVTSVGTNWAIIQTLSNENIKVAGYVERSSENNGIIEGYKDDNNKLLATIKIPTLESDIKEGDIILTSGIGQIYPKGIRVGEIIDINENKGEVSKYGIIKPYVDINKLEEVFIVIPKESREVVY